ncbi:hypothetical protein MTO96_012327 [Rhipicephalus appendiculatus]
MTIERCELERRRIMCSAGSQVCGFSGNLSDLADHLTLCGGGKIKCCRCNQPVFRGDSVNHYRSCTGHLHIANDDAAYKEADVEKSTQELMLSKVVDLEEEFGGFKIALTEKVAGLERQMLEGQRKSSSDVASYERQLLEVREKFSNVVANLERQLLEVQKKSSNDVATLERQFLEVQEKSSGDVASLERQLLEVQEKSSNDVATLERQLLEVQEESSNDVATLVRQLLEVHEESSNDVATLERQLLEVQEKSSGDVASLERNLLEVQKKFTSDNQSAVAAQKAAVIQGPHRAAPRGGVFTTTCKFTDICTHIDSLNGTKKELRISTDTCTLGGYTFKLECKFTKDGNIRNSAFALFLRDGEWDSYLDWPFGKKVTLIIMRPKESGKRHPLAGKYGWPRVGTATECRLLEQCPFHGDGELAGH